MLHHSSPNLLLGVDVSKIAAKDAIPVVSLGIRINLANVNEDDLASFQGHRGLIFVFLVWSRVIRWLN